MHLREMFKASKDGSEGTALVRTINETSRVVHSRRQQRRCYLACYFGGISDMQKRWRDLQASKVPAFHGLFKVFFIFFLTGVGRRRRGEGEKTEFILDLCRKNIFKYCTVSFGSCLALVVSSLLVGHSVLGGV